MWEDFFLCNEILLKLLMITFYIGEIYVYFDRFYAILTNINSILKELNVFNEILTNYYSRYQDNTKDFNKFSKIPI
jgi:hypothetical protein